MLFNSISYCFFLPIVFIIYYLLPNKFRNFFLLIASIFFYANWIPKYLILIFGTIFITYLTSILISKYKKYGKLLLAFVIIVNILVLVIFKYNNFFIKNINLIFKFLKINFVISDKFNIMLPVGISFYTFQSIGYCIDVYRGNVKCEKNFIIYASFVMFFPQLVAGPIERSGNLIKQFHKEHKFEYKKGVEGLRYILSGMYRKVVIADICAVIVNSIYSNVHSYTGITLIFGTILFAIQIYCDFSGYSMIAIGSGKLLGFDLMENFKSPYFSKNIKEFWGKWHISLSTWFRDYIYIPLGGSKKGFIRKLVNILIIFLISGLWHGAAWTFIIWGFIHSLYRIIEEIFNICRKKSNKESNESRKFNKIFNIFYVFTTFILVCIAWVFFRSDSFSDAIFILKNSLSNFSLKMFYINYINIIYSALLNKKIFIQFLTIILIISILYLSIEDFCMNKGEYNISTFYEKLGRKKYFIYFFQSIVIILIYMILQTTYGQAGQFIYFQF